VSTLPHQQAVRWPTLIVLASLAAVAPVSTDLYLPGFPELGDDLDASASGVQLTLTAFLVGLAVGQLVMGPLSDRYGRRTPLIASTTVCVVAGVVCAVAPTLPILVGGRLVQCLAGAGGMVIGRAVLADLVTGKAAAKAFTLMLTVGGAARDAPGLGADRRRDVVRRRAACRRADPWLLAAGRDDGAVVRDDDGLHLSLAVRLPERRRPLGSRVRRRLRRQRRRADLGGLGLGPDGGALRPAPDRALLRECPSGSDADICCARCR